jgi:heptaprenyl diphosphate synthase
VKGVLVQWFEEMRCPGFALQERMDDVLGKMLRTRLAAEVLGKNPEQWPLGIEYACAAVEMIHTASLFHDDVVDGASLRRGKPALWRVFSPNSAILLGDILFCEALSKLAASPGSRHVSALLDKGREVCIAEAEQELSLRGFSCDFSTCLRIARSKTGPLFAFVGQACGHANDGFSKAMEEVGYRIGTAYQFADDWMDETGDEAAAGKTLGTDRLRRKFTLARSGPESDDLVTRCIAELCGSSLDILQSWPAERAGLESFLSTVFFPACRPGSRILQNH